jgi:hypothetical protein
MKKTILTLALVAGLTSFAGNAEADIVYNVLNININSSAKGFAYNNGVIYVDASQTDGSFGSIYANPPYEDEGFTVPAQIYGNGPTYNTSGKISASALNPGDVMDSQTSISGTLDSFSSVNPASLNTPFYYGIRFRNDGTNFNYGWLEAETTDSSIRFIAAAVETSANVGITAGAVPEPSTYALFGLGAIGMLMVLRRKRTA